MNLQALTASATNSVNPMIPCSLQVSTGSVTNADFSKSPSYAAPVSVMGQIQSLTFSDLHQTDGLNLQGTKRAIYLQGDIEGLLRPSGKGGDLITMPDGTIWLVAMVLESWGQNTGKNGGNWCKVAVTLQDNA